MRMVDSAGVVVAVVDDDVVDGAVDGVVGVVEAAE